MSKSILNMDDTINMSVNKSIKYNITDLNYKYNLLFLEYNKNFNKIKNTTFNKYNYLTGISIITNVYHITLLTTRNLNLTIFHTQKAIYYYIEFLEQIYDNNNKFLKLTTNEAVFFVYKKTTFELQPPKNMLSRYSKFKLFILKELTDIYKLIISHYIDDYSVNFIYNQIIVAFNLKKKIKYNIFYANLKELYYVLVDTLEQSSLEDVIKTIDIYFNKKHITNKIFIE